MSLAMVSDRRVQPRVALEKPIELYLEDASSPIATTTVNLSHSGICVPSVPGASVGDAVRCRLLFTPKEPLALSARVVWRGQRDMMGLAFEDVTEQRGDSLARYLRRLAPASGDGSAALTIDPFCESGTWSREILVDEELYEETAETLQPERRYHRFLWGVIVGALAGGLAAAAVALVLTR